MPSIPAAARNVMSSRREPPDALDYFPTPPWAARAGAELIARLDPPADGARWTCWEPACGEGHMAMALVGPPGPFAEVFTTDVWDYGFGRTMDFLGEEASAQGGQWDWIVTNPPFIKGADFVRLGLRRARRGVAVLCRLAFIEGAGRHQLMFVEHPLSVLAPFIERVPMVKGRWDPKASSATAYAWFVWVKGRAEQTPWVVPIPPGSRERLSRADDARRWGVTAPMSLFEDAP